MRHGTHANPAGAPRDGRRGRPSWRWATPAVLLGCGVLLATSAANSDGSDLRPARYTGIASLVRGEAAEADRLNARVADLNRDIEGLSAGLNDRRVNRVRHRITELNDPAGMTAQHGPGITVELTDSPAELVERSSEKPDTFVVHQQDIQAVVNAMWRGGATAVTLMGQRIVSTTGIKCEGNAVTLHGIPYSPPYVITAIGDPTAISLALENDPWVAGYRQLSADPAIALGWEIRGEVEAHAPAYEGLLDTNYATPIED